MKIRPFVLFAALLLVSTALHAAQVPKLETLLAEYKKARTDVLGKLKEAYASQADMLAEQYLAMPDLEQAERARRYAKSLRDPGTKHEAREASLGANDPTATDPITLMQANYIRAREENVNNVYAFYSTTAENLRQELLRSKDKAGAEVLTAFLEKIKLDGPAAIGTATPAKTRQAPGK